MDPLRGTASIIDSETGASNDATDADSADAGDGIIVGALDLTAVEYEINVLKLLVVDRDTRLEGLCKTMLQEVEREKIGPFNESKSWIPQGCAKMGDGRCATITATTRTAD